MKVHLCTFTDERMTISAHLLCSSSMKHGVDDSLIYIPEHLPEYFKQMAADNLKVSKGYGLYIWKPFVVWDYMNKLKDGDILIYADAGQTIISSLRPVIDSMDQEIMCFSNGWRHVEWCKADVYHSILPGRGFNNGEDKQVQASLIFFKVTPATRNFVKEWMLWCLMPGFCDDSPSKLTNYPTFAETRWDQSVLCCLQIKYGYSLHWLPALTAFHIKADYPNDRYPAIVDYHRKRNDEW